MTQSTTGADATKGAFALSRLWSPPSPRAIPAKRPPPRPRVRRETFGMLRLRGFSLSVFCDPCKESHFINLVERPISKPWPWAASISNAGGAASSATTG